MPTDKQTKLIEEILADRQEAISAALVEEAEAVAAAAATSTLRELERMHRTKWTRSVVEGITEQQVASYRAQVAKGGTDIIVRVIKDIGNGKVSVTTQRTFTPWLNDMATRDSEEILRIIGEGQRGGMHPKQIARSLRDYFDGTQHNAMTAARTEAQKIRTDARFATYAKAGVHHVQCITAGDEEVRPDHAARDGKIYKVQDAPYLGEPNCRCSFIDADFAVEERGMPVEGSGAIILSAEEILA